jgi:hypothetical protein
MRQKAVATNLQITAIRSRPVAQKEEEKGYLMQLIQRRLAKCDVPTNTPPRRVKMPTVQSTVIKSVAWSRSCFCETMVVI